MTATPDPQLTAALDRFAAALLRSMELRVATSLALSAERYDKELADLVRDVTRLADAVTQLTRIVHSLIEPPELHSVKVDP